MRKFSSLVIRGVCALMGLLGVVYAEENVVPESQLVDLDTTKLATGATIYGGTNGLVLYDVVPLAANQGWLMQVFDISNPIGAHYHDDQSQLVVVLEGKLKATMDHREVIVSSGQVVTVPPGVIHSLTPVDGKCRMLAIDLQAAPFPEDVYFLDEAPEITETLSPLDFSEVVVDQSLTDLADALGTIPEIDSNYYVQHFDKGAYGAYEIIPPNVVKDSRWSVALLEIKEAPKHYHLVGSEIFLVVNGELQIEVDGVDYHLLPGNWINIPPGAVHALRSSTEQPVRVICVNLPAFNPKDFYPME